MVTYSYYDVTLSAVPCLNTKLYQVLQIRRHMPRRVFEQSLPRTVLEFCSFVWGVAGRLFRKEKVLSRINIHVYITAATRKLASRPLELLACMRLVYAQSKRFLYPQRLATFCTRGLPMKQAFRHNVAPVACRFYFLDLVLVQPLAGAAFFPPSLFSAAAAPWAPKTCCMHLWKRSEHQIQLSVTGHRSR